MESLADRQRGVHVKLSFDLPEQTSVCLMRAHGNNLGRRTGVKCFVAVVTVSQVTGSPLLLLLLLLRSLSPSSPPPPLLHVLLSYHFLLIIISSSSSFLLLLLSCLVLLLPVLSIHLSSFISISILLFWFLLSSLLSHLPSPPFPILSSAPLLCPLPLLFPSPPFYLSSVLTHILS